MSNLQSFILGGLTYIIILFLSYQIPYYIAKGWKRGNRE